MSSVYRWLTSVLRDGAGRSRAVCRVLALCAAVCATTGTPGLLHGQPMPPAGTVTGDLEPSSAVVPLHRTRVTEGLIISGFSGRRLLLSLDGLRLDTDLVEGTALPWLSLLDPRAVEVDAVLRPVDAGRWGIDGPGGGVRWSSAAPELPPEATAVSLRAAFASAELERGGDARMALRRGDVTAWGGARVRQTSGLRAGLESLRGDDDGFLLYGGDAGLDLDVGAGTLSLRYLGGRGTDLSAAVSEDAATRRLLDVASVTYRPAAGPVTEPGSAPPTPSVRLGVVRQLREGSDLPAQSVLVAAHGELPITPGQDLGGAVEVELSHEAADAGGRTLAEARGDLEWDGPVQIGGWATLGIAAVRAQGTDPLVEPTAGIGASVTHRWLDDRLGTSLTASTTQRAPAVAERAGHVLVPDASVLASPDLGSERFVHAELGVSWAQEPLAARLGFFVARGFGAIDIVETGLFDPARFDDAGRPLPFVAVENAGGLRIFGVRGDVEVSVGDLRLFVDTTWTRGADARGPAASVPALVGHAGIRYLGDVWGFEPYLRFATTQDRVAAGELATPGHAVIGVRGYSRLSTWGLVALAVDNLADQGYRVHGSAAPEPGIDARISLTVDLD